LLGRLVQGEIARQADNPNAGRVLAQLRQLRAMLEYRRGRQELREFDRSSDDVPLPDSPF